MDGAAGAFALRFVVFFARLAGAALRLAGVDLRAAFLAFFALRFAGARRVAGARFFATLRLAFFFAGAFFLVLRAILVSLK